MVAPLAVIIAESPVHIEFDEADTETTGKESTEIEIMALSVQVPCVPTTVKIVLEDGVAVTLFPESLLNSFDGDQK